MFAAVEAERKCLLGFGTLVPMWNLPGTAILPIYVTIQTSYLHSGELLPAEVRCVAHGSSGSGAEQHLGVGTQVLPGSSACTCKHHLIEARDWGTAPDE